MSYLFYWVVIQAFFLFGEESWAVLDAMMSMVDVNYVGFLCQITGKQASRQAVSSWETPEAEEMLWSVGIQSVATYIGRWQAKVAQWLDL